MVMANPKLNRLSKQQAEIALVLIKAGGPLTARQIAFKIGKDENSKAHIRRQIFRIREKLGKESISRIENTGYLWKG